MFKQLEEIYKSNSLYRLLNKLLIGGLFIFLICCFIFIDKINSNFLNDLFPLLVIVVLLLLIYFIIIIILLKNKKISFKHWKTIINPLKSIELYYDLAKEVDLSILISTLDKMGIKNKENLKLVINHYNSLITEEHFSLKGFFLSVLPIIITIITYISSDGIHYNTDKLDIILSVILITSIFLVIIYAFFYIISKLFGRKELYKIIEESLCEIYVNFDNLRDTYIEKVLIILGDNKFVNSEEDIIKEFKFLDYETIICHFNDYSLLTATFSKNLKYIFILTHRKDFANYIKLNINYNKYLGNYMKIKNNLKKIYISKKFFSKDQKYIFNFCLKFSSNTFLINIPQNIKLYSEIYTLINELKDN